MSAYPFPPQPPQPWMALPVPGGPGVETLARPVSPEENVARARITYWRALTTLVLPLLLGCGAFVTLLGGWLFVSSGVHAAPSWLVPLFTWLFVCVVSLAIGVPIGLAASRRRAESELGVGRTLTVAWNRLGFSIAGPRGLRGVPFSDVRSVRRGGAQDWFVVIRLRMRLMSADPFILVLPGDLVPSWALEALYAPGGAR